MHLVPPGAGQPLGGFPPLANPSGLPPRGRKPRRLPPMVRIISELFRITVLVSKCKFRISLFFTSNFDFSLFEFGQLSDNFRLTFRTIFGQLFVHFRTTVWTTVGQLLFNFWTLFGQLFGPLLDKFWITFGPLLDNFIGVQSRQSGLRGPNIESKGSQIQSKMSKLESRSSKG